MSDAASAWLSTLRIRNWRYMRYKGNKPIGSSAWSRFGKRYDALQALRSVTVETFDLAFLARRPEDAAQRISVRTRRVSRSRVKIRSRATAAITASILAGPRLTRFPPDDHAMRGMRSPAPSAAACCAFSVGFRDPSRRLVIAAKPRRRGSIHVSVARNVCSHRPRSTLA
jgi:hypothetical protein